MSTPDQLYDQALDLRDSGDKPAAIAKLEEAITINPDFALRPRDARQALCRPGGVGQGDLSRQEGGQLEPDDTFSYTALSVIYQRCGKIPEAEHAKALAFNKQHGLD